MSRNRALKVFRAALKAADPAQAVLRQIRFDGKTLKVAGRRYALSKFDRIQVIGAGKASAAMARALDRVLGSRIAGGAINVKAGDTARLRRIAVNQCGHPVPDRRGLEGARRIAEIARAAGERDLLVCVISGGASALLADPAPGITLGDVQKTTKRLLASGGTIHELNAVRKHISALKGGQLAALASPATMIALILSDVVGDDLDVIGSGPTVADSSTFADAARVLKKYSIRAPDAVQKRIGMGLKGASEETPNPGDPRLARVQNLIVGSNRQAIDAAARQARELGYHTLVLSTRVEGEAREIARMHAAIAKEVLASGRPVRAPACILSGGETTVTIRGKGLGGRNQEFVLAASLELQKLPVTIFSAGTDGTDGPTDAAGAVADQSMTRRAEALGLDIRAFLDNNDSYHFFEKVDRLVKTGHTGTNVMDVRIMLVEAQ